MSLINGTLVVQAFFFLLTWRFLDTFLFPYLVYEVQEEDAVKKKILSLMATRSEWYDLLKKQQQESWNKFYKEVHVLLPHVFEKNITCALTGRPERFKPISHERKKLLIDQVAQYVEKRLVLHE